MPPRKAPHPDYFRLVIDTVTSHHQEPTNSEWKLTLAEQKPWPKWKRPLNMPSRRRKRGYFESVGMTARHLPILLQLMKNRLNQGDDAAASAVLSVLSAAANVTTEAVFQGCSELLQRHPLGEEALVRLYRHFANLSPFHHFRNEESICLELYLLFMKGGDFQLAYDHVHSYLHREPFKSNSLFHFYCGLAAYCLACRDYDSLVALSSSAGSVKMQSDGASVKSEPLEDDDEEKDEDEDNEDEAPRHLKGARRHHQLRPFHQERDAERIRTDLNTRRTHAFKCFQQALVLDPGFCASLDYLSRTVCLSPDWKTVRQSFHAQRLLFLVNQLGSFHGLSPSSQSTATSLPSFSESVHFSSSPFPTSSYPSPPDPLSALRVQLSIYALAWRLQQQVAAASTKSEPPASSSPFPLPPQLQSILCGRYVEELEREWSEEPNDNSDDSDDSDEEEEDEDQKKKKTSSRRKSMMASKKRRKEKDIKAKKSKAKLKRRRLRKDQASSDSEGEESSKSRINKKLEDENQEEKEDEAEEKSDEEPLDISELGSSKIREGGPASLLACLCNTAVRAVQLEPSDPKPLRLLAAVYAATSALPPNASSNSSPAPSPASSSSSAPPSLQAVLMPTSRFLPLLCLHLDVNATDVALWQLLLSILVQRRSPTIASDPLSSQHDLWLGVNETEHRERYRWWCESALHFGALQETASLKPSLLWHVRRAVFQTLCRIHAPTQTK